MNSIRHSSSSTFSDSRLPEGDYQDVADAIHRLKSLGTPIFEIYQVLLFLWGGSRPESDNALAAATAIESAWERNQTNTVGLNQRIMADLQSVLDTHQNYDYFNKLQELKENGVIDKSMHMQVFLREKARITLSHGPLHGVFSSFNHSIGVVQSEYLLKIKALEDLQRKVIYEPFQKPFHDLCDFCAASEQAFVDRWHEHGAQGNFLDRISGWQHDRVRSLITLLFVIHHGSENIMIDKIEQMSLAIREENNENDIQLDEESEEVTNVDFFNALNRTSTGYRALLTDRVSPHFRNVAKNDIIHCLGGQPNPMGALNIYTRDIINEYHEFLNQTHESDGHDIDHAAREWLLNKMDEELE